jgi:Asp-tRNA(Asn)/Glu-tRNA(Gln) amidotransferase A subunit family amidase
MEPHELNATQALAAMQEGSLDAETLVRSCLSHISRREPEVRAWVSLDKDAALRQARELDKQPRRGLLHGLPVGIKDVIATRGLPTTYNSPHYADHRIEADAACIRILRREGAIILGKTDTVEFATGGRRASTRHPLDLERGPGGSSSGSAAAVADHHVPLTIGTQTSGSMIRPASICGVWSFKPTHGLVSTEGVRHTAPSLDTLGWFARSAQDLSLVARAFRLSAPPAEAVTRPKDLRIGFCRTPHWPVIAASMRSTYAQAAARLEALGCTVIDVDLPEPVACVAMLHRKLVDFEAPISLLADHLDFGEGLHPDLHRRFASETPPQWDPAALFNTIAAARQAFDALFAGPEALDVLIVPSAADEAPVGRQSTGNSTMNGMWTLPHAPCANLSVGRAPSGMPLGLQATGPRYSDFRLLEIAVALGAALSDGT